HPVKNSGQATTFEVIFGIVRFTGGVGVEGLSVKQKSVERLFQDFVDVFGIDRTIFILTGQDPVVRFNVPCGDIEQCLHVSLTQLVEEKIVERGGCGSQSVFEDHPHVQCEVL